MRQCFRRKWKKFKHRDNWLQNTDNKQTFDSSRYKESSSAHAESSASVSYSEKLHEPSEQKRDTGPKDLWQIAYEKLSNEDQQVLLADQPSSQSPQIIDHGKDDKILGILEEVIRLTEQQYEDYRNGGLKITRGSGKEDIDIRDIAHRILDATLSFKDIISAIAAFDPTGHASSAWAIVSLGLTMTKNHIDIQSALFRSSEFLADVLARCAFIEKNNYCNNQFETKDKIENALVQVYTSTLYYSARVRKQQKANLAKRMLESIPAVSNHPIIQIESFIKSDEQILHCWVQADEHLQHKKSAEDMLGRIDKVIDLVQQLDQKLDRSNLRNAEGASFDSFMNQHEDKCLPGTRAEILQQIKEWESSEQGQGIFWLNGMAGTGKSTISRTVAAMFKEEGKLGASFFFKRGGGDRGNAKRFFSTITRQLITAAPQLEPSVSKAIKDDPDVSTKSLREQFNKLLLQPICSISQNKSAIRLVLVVDALDESDGQDDIRVILELLPQLQKPTSMHLRIFLTSRPELPIRLGFQEIDNKRHQDLILHGIPEQLISRDIALFLSDRLSYIQQKRSLPEGWPGDNRVQALVERTEPLFISAATLCRFVGDEKWNPETRLTAILNDQINYVSKMDNTYLPVLRQLLTGQDEWESEQLVQEFKGIVGVIILLATPLSVNALARLLDTGACDVSSRLDSFRSVLNIPDDCDIPVRILHLSFRDFLLDPKIKDKQFWIDEKETHQKVTAQCLRVMREGLRKNPCKLELDGTQRTEIDRCLIDESIPPELQYSCRYWVQHLELCKDPMEKMDDVFSFLQEHFLYWMEAMSILGLASELVGMIDTMQQFIPDNKYSQLSALVQDARRFILKTRHLADTAPLQLYSSGLIFAPIKSIIRETFKKDIPGWIYRSPDVEQYWSAELETIEGHTHSVWSVAFSMDGRLLASASDDKTVKLWDPTSGTLRHTLEGHSDWVSSVAFSMDGQLLASASGDKTVKLWDPTSGTLRHTLEGHSDWVSSVAFSMDGRLLASASGDKTVKLWDPTSDTLHHTLEGHSHTISSVAFSIDGQLLASASGDKTVKLWDLTSGTLRHTLEGHSDWVSSVAFSTDGQLLASASGDKTVKLWDLTSGTLRHTLGGHTHSVWSVAFSMDGRLLASASDDKTVKLWDPTSGTLRHTLEGHSDWVNSVAFSMDGRLLASASDDKTVKLWDLTSGTLCHTLEGHSHSVWSVAFSMDGQLLASASDDKTVKLWDLTSGTLRHTLEGHSHSVWLVAFSMDGQLLASASDDKTVKLWDPTSGTLRHTLKGHGIVHKLNSSYLETDLGIFYLPPPCGNENPVHLTKIEVCILDNEWVVIQGRKFLWLPPTYRPTCEATQNGMLAMGHASGRVTFVEFCL